MKALILFVFIACFKASATEIKSFSEIEKQVNALANKYGANKTLVVLDIDNTVLTMPRQFGSDQWFSWQSKNCLGKSFNAKYCVADDFSELLDVQGELFAVMNMVPAEKITIDTIKRFQKNGHKVILLTSRGPSFRNSTEREINRNGLDLKVSAIGPASGYGGTYLPYKLNNPQRYGLKQNEITELGLKKPRPVSYMNGIYMTAGQNKGVMLRNLLAKTGVTFKAIVFADDHHKHIVRMNEAFKKYSAMDVKALRYGAIDPSVEEFKKKGSYYSTNGAIFYRNLKKSLKQTL